MTLLHSCTAYTCEFLLAAVSYTLLQVLKLVFHLLILPLCLLTLPPEKIKHTHTKKTHHENKVKQMNVNLLQRGSFLLATNLAARYLLVLITQSLLVCS